MANRMPTFNEEYVMEILRALRPNMTRFEFQEATRHDWNAGQRAEVLEAEKRYYDNPGKQGAW